MDVYCRECGNKKLLAIFIKSNYCLYCLRRTSNEFRVQIVDTINVRDNIKIKKKANGFKKFASLVISGWFSSRSHEGGVEISRSMDKENDQYVEIVKDCKTGKVLHECQEKLSEHRGHGSAKFKQ